MDARELQSRGGKARAKKLTKKQRIESAKHAIKARWDRYRKQNSK